MLIYVEKVVSMRKTTDDLIAEAKKCTTLDEVVGMMCIFLVVNFMKNMYLPSFGLDQPGETYYYTPVNINKFRIVNFNNNNNNKKGPSIKLHIQ